MRFNSLLNRKTSRKDDCLEAQRQGISSNCKEFGQLFYNLKEIMLRNTEANKQKKVNCSVINRCSSTVKCEKQIPRSSKQNNVNWKSQANDLPLLVEEKSSLHSLTISSNSFSSIKTRIKSITCSRDGRILFKIYPYNILHPMVESKTIYHKLSLDNGILQDLSHRETSQYQCLSINDGIVPDQYRPIAKKTKYLHLSLDVKTFREDDPPEQTHIFEKNDLHQDPITDTKPKCHNFSSDNSLQNSDLDRELLNCIDKFKRKINKRFHILLDSELSECVEELMATINHEFSNYKKVERVPTLRELALRSLEENAVDQISSTHLTSLRKPANLSTVTTSSKQASTTKVNSKPDAVKEKEINNKHKGNNKKDTPTREPWVN